MKAHCIIKPDITFVGLYSYKLLGICTDILLTYKCGI